MRLRGVVVVLGAVGLLAAGCSHEPEVKAMDKIDVAAWKAEVAAMPGNLANPDMDGLNKVTLGQCNGQRDMTTMMTMTGADANLSRTDMKYVCPTRAHMVDVALTQIQQNSVDLAQACKTQKSLRTVQQQEL